MIRNILVALAVVLAQVLLGVSLASAQGTPARIDSLAPVVVNNRAWRVFETSDNKDSLETAITQMRERILEVENDVHYEYLDTYANLLYKVGRVAEAIMWQGRAVAQASEAVAAVRRLEANLAKMKAGQPTWRVRTVP